MKDYIKRYAYTYAIVSFVFLIVCFVIQKRLNIGIPFYKAGVGTILISLLIALSITIFKIKKGNFIIKIILGFVALLPIVLIMRRVFGVIVFRYSFIAYLFVCLCGIIYGIALLVASKKVKKEAKYLNRLLENKKSDDEE